MFSNAEYELNNGNWKKSLILWAKEINQLIESDKYLPEYAKFTRKIAKLAKSSGEEKEARLACQEVLLGIGNSLYDKGKGRKRYPKLTKYYECEHIRKIHWLNNEKWEWFSQWLYWAIAGRVMTYDGIVRLFLIVNVGLTLFFASIFYFGDGLEWTDSNKTEPLQEYHYVYFSGLTLTTLGYGDIHPKPESWFMCLLSIAEAMVGYLLLGMVVWGFTAFNSIMPRNPGHDLPGRISELLEAPLFKDVNA